MAARSSVEKCEPTSDSPGDFSRTQERSRADLLDRGLPSREGEREGLALPSRDSLLSILWTDWREGGGLTSREASGEREALPEGLASREEAEARRGILLGDLERGCRLESVAL